MLHVGVGGRRGAFRGLVEKLERKNHLEGESWVEGSCCRESFKN